jgi:hypothetical protein
VNIAASNLLYTNTSVLLGAEGNIKTGGIANKCMHSPTDPFYVLPLLASPTALLCYESHVWLFEVMILTPSSLVQL